MTIIAMILGISLDGQAHKYWEYTQRTGTIRRVKRKQPGWIFKIAKWSLKRFDGWLGQAIIVSAVMHYFQLWGPGVLWLLGCLAIRNFVTQRRSNTKLNFAVFFGVIALPGALVLSLSTPVEASTSVMPATLQAGQAISAIGANYLLDSRIVDQNGPFNSNRYKISIDVQFILYQKLIENPQISSKELLISICEIRIEISISQVNRIRKDWNLSAPKGRPRSTNNQEENQPQTKTSLQPYAGVKLFSLYLEANDKYYETLRAIHLAIAFYKYTCNEGDFRLLHAREQTIEKKWKALTILSLLGIKRLSELDYHEHQLDRILGFDYGYSALTQFLGELERIDAGYFLNCALSIDAQGNYCYIDTHKIAYYSRKKMHKGMITSKGKVMGGSCAVIAHDQCAQTVAVEYHPPDTHLSQKIKNFCADIVEVTGIKSFIIDREVNSAKTARLFVDNGWELICLLASNEYKGLDSFKCHFCTELEDGTRLYKATWKQERENDPRKFVISANNDDIIVYWVTPKLFERLTAQEVIIIYRNRTEIQENTIKDMKMHGALDINYGRKTLPAPDRTHQRKIDKVEQKIQRQKTRLEKTQQSIEQQAEKVRESILCEHGALLQTRRNKLDQYQQKEQEIQEQLKTIEQQKEDLGTRGHREDRDLRKQHIMTCRTAWLENQLKNLAHVAI